MNRLLAEAMADPLLTTREAAGMFRVNPKTLSRWAQAGKLMGIRTGGNHRRFRTSEIKALIEAQTDQGKQ